MNKVLDSVEAVLFVCLVVLFSIVFVGPLVTTLWVLLLEKLQTKGRNGGTKKEGPEE